MSAPYVRVQRIAIDKPWMRDVPRHTRRGVAGVTPREDVHVPLEDIISLVRKHSSNNRYLIIGRKFPSGRKWLGWKARAFDGAHHRES